MTRPADYDAAEPGSDQMGDAYLDRDVVLCRTCMRPLTWETRTEPGYLPRTGWYDDARVDPLVCFKAIDYRHIPLTAREWGYYKAGRESVIPSAETDVDPVSRVQAIEAAEDHADQTVFDAWRERGLPCDCRGGAHGGYTCDGCRA